MSINRIMDIGRGAMAASQTGLNTTSHNISNANTRGYSRQRVDFQTAEPAQLGQHRLGRGVDIGKVERTVSQFVQTRLRDENSMLGKYEGMAEVYNQLDNIFKDDSAVGISGGVSNFFNEVRSLSTQPDSIPLRTAVIESAKSVVTRFRTADESLRQVVQDLDRRVEGAIVDINSLSHRVADLNQRILQAELDGGHANDERDARDLAIQDMAKFLDLRTFTDEKGMISVQVDGMGLLVAGSDTFELGTARGARPDGYGGTVGVVIMGGNGEQNVREVTDFVRGGSLGGFLHIRDNMVPGLRGRIDNMANEFATQVNNVHRAAYGRDGEMGRDFFVSNGNVYGAANNLTVNEDVIRDPSLLGAASRPSAPGDNTALLALADLQDAKIFNGGQATFMDYSSGIIGTVGVEVRANMQNLETQNGVMQQLDAMREQVSGVSLDEETMDMLRFQKAFDASAKLIQVADSMMETVLTLKRF